MSAYRFSCEEVERMLALAAEGLALAGTIERDLRELAPCAGAEFLWRGERSR